jgi:acetamidase/formamidase
VPHAHELDDAEVHHVWDRGLPPRLQIDPGDTVRIRCRDSLDGAVGRDATIETLLAGRPIRGHPLTGPILVRGARAGDVLAVEVLEVTVAGLGWTTFRPGAGLLPDEFTRPYLKVWELRDGYAELCPGVRVPLAPFLGVMGVAPEEAGEHATGPPRKWGGNMDIRHLVAGSTLYLPVAVDGALFSAGDGHAAQGDGEVCVSAIETAAIATLRFTVRRDRTIASPELETPAATRAAGRCHVTTGIGPDLMAASRDAVRAMIAFLASERGLTREEAYVLCSVAVDLRIAEIVDAPNWVVAAFLPLAMFD